MFVYLFVVCYINKNNCKSRRLFRIRIRKKYLTNHATFSNNKNKDEKLEKNTRGGTVSLNCSVIVPALNWVIENQLMVSVIQHSQEAESNLVADEKGHSKREGGSYLLHLYFMLMRS